MTNGEKFEEVFGIDVTDHPLNLCDLDSELCKKHWCDDCPLFDFWNREYGEGRSHE